MSLFTMCIELLFYLTPPSCGTHLLLFWPQRDGEGGLEVVRFAVKLQNVPPLQSTHARHGVGVVLVHRLGYPHVVEELLHKGPVATDTRLYGTAQACSALRQLCIDGHTYTYSYTAAMCK